MIIIEASIKTNQKQQHVMSTLLGAHYISVAVAVQDAFVESAGGRDRPHRAKHRLIDKDK
jgi:hypothetical protein